MIVFAVSNEKGGQAKTTTTAALSEGAARRGYRVLAIDGDPQGALSYELNKGETETDQPGLYEVMTGAINIGPAAISSRTENLDFLKASNAMTGLDRILAGNVGVLRAALRKVTRLYDYVFIDCPAIVNIMQLNAIICADKLIIPATPDSYAVRSIQHTLAVMTDAQKAGSNIELAGILFTKVRKRGLLDNSVISSARQTMTAPIFHSVIHDRAYVKQQAVMCNCIMGGTSETANEYYRVLDELNINDKEETQ